MNLLEVASLGTQRAAQAHFNYANPTPGTGIVTNATPTAITATEALLIIDNSATATGGLLTSGIYVVPKRISLMCTAAGTAATSATLYFFLDKKNRWASGGTTLVGNPMLIDTSETFTTRVPLGKVYFGDVTANTASATKLMYQMKMKTATAPCFDVGDRFVFDIDGPGSSNIDNASGAQIVTFKLPVIYIGRLSSLIVHTIFPSASAGATFEVEVETIELFHPREQVS